MGGGSDCSLREVPWVCAKLFSDVQFNTSHKRIMLFTSEDNPHGNDSAKASQARTKTGDLRETGIFLDLMHLKKPGGFDISLFYRDIISTAEDEDFRVHFEESSKLEDLLRKVRAKETGSEHSTGGLLLPSGTKKSQIYGSRQIILEKEETEELKRFDDRGLMLTGFIQALGNVEEAALPDTLPVRVPRGVSGDWELNPVQCSAHQVSGEGGRSIVQIHTPENIPPYFVALVPQDKELDDQKIQEDALD
ncbi:X-ray repair cross-complementing protein 6 [Plecturocebus cupreus]